MLSKTSNVKTGTEDKYASGPYICNYQSHPKIVYGKFQHSSDQPIL